jgi:hypothetical protein
VANTLYPAKKFKKEKFFEWYFLIGLSRLQACLSLDLLACQLLRKNTGYKKNAAAGSTKKGWIAQLV